MQKDAPFPKLFQFLEKSGSKSLDSENMASDLAAHAGAVTAMDYQHLMAAYQQQHHIDEQV